MRPKKKVSGKNGTEILIPEKLYFRIGEVARLCRLPAYVLRFWETEFPQLLYEDGFTIAGARSQLREEVKVDKNQVALPFPGKTGAELAHIRQGLQEILTILSARR